MVLVLALLASFTMRQPQAIIIGRPACDVGSLSVPPPELCLPSFPSHMVRALLCLSNALLDVQHAKPA